MCYSGRAFKKEAQFLNKVIVRELGLYGSGYNA
jgi:hypothetical protein